ncbi:hypothetical protein HPB50_027119 [Hyalomma asiaticum]|uniref:Uncharacterized protein n=1 Tax=Hyalomma asiaticum TaxID=266040 RepID=A0ACB7RND4_HYAAI|nr:hypothetical protein HPB50_027119 [Hyalomma asiaticum]
MADFVSDDSQPLVVDLEMHQGGAVPVPPSSLNSTIQGRAFARGPAPASWRRFYVTRNEGTKMIGTCLICNENIRAAAGVSSNLLRHLKRKHPRELHIAMKLRDGKHGPKHGSSLPSSSSINKVSVSSSNSVK